jgi:hypothetical protein
LTEDPELACLCDTLHANGVMRARSGGRAEELRRADRAPVVKEADEEAGHES